MKPFIHADFLLETETARRLYHEVAKQQPIIDYHCHLPPDQIAQNHRFRSLKPGLRAQIARFRRILHVSSLRSAMGIDGRELRPLL